MAWCLVKLRDNFIIIIIIVIIIMILSLPFIVCSNCFCVYI
jgi:hypothetical protein